MSRRGQEASFRTSNHCNRVANLKNAPHHKVRHKAVQTLQRCERFRSIVCRNKVLKESGSESEDNVNASETLKGTVTYVIRPHSSTARYSCGRLRTSSVTLMIPNIREIPSVNACIQLSYIFDTHALQRTFGHNIALQALDSVPQALDASSYFTRKVYAALITFSICIFPPLRVFHLIRTKLRWIRQ